MARVNNKISHFLGGEISQNMRARSDLQTFENAAERMENFYPTRQGGAKYRPGSLLFGTTHEVPDAIRFLRFEFNETDSYIIEATPLLFRYYDSGGILSYGPGAGNTGAIVGLEKGVNTFIVHIDAAAAATGFATTNTCSFFGIEDVGFEALNGKSFLPSAVGASAFSAGDIAVTIPYTGNTAVAAFAPTAGTPYGYAHVCTATNYTAAEIPFLQYAQKDDVMWITSGQRRPVTLTRSLAGGAGDSSLTVGWRAAITLISNNYVAFTLANYAANLSGGGNGFSTAGNYPRAVALHEGRLWWGGTVNNPDTIWGSELGVYADLTYTSPASTTDTESLEFKLAGDADTVTHLAPSKDFLYIQCLGGGIALDGGGPSLAITPTQVAAKRLHDIGSHSYLPFIKKDQDIMFVEKNGKQVRKLSYSFDKDKWRPIDLSQFNPDIVDSKGAVTYSITAAAVKQGERDQVFFLKNDGTVACMTYDDASGQVAWSRMTPAQDGYTHWTHDQAKILAVGSEPHPYGNEILYTATKRAGDVVYLSFSEDSLEYLTMEDVRFSYQFSGSSAATESNDRFILDGQNEYKDQLNLFTDDAAFGTFWQTTTLALDNSALDVGDTGTCTAGASVFTSSDVGKKIKGIRNSYLVDDNPPYGVATITGYTSATQVTYEVEEKFYSSSLSALQWTLEKAAGDKIYGFYHLRGLSLHILCDGEEQADLSIGADGAIVLPVNCTSYEVGCRYRGYVKTTNILGGGTVGPSDTKDKNIHRMGVQFLNTVGTQFGTDPYNMETVYYRMDDNPTDQSTRLFTGEKQVKFSDKWESEKNIYFVQNVGRPCHILAVVPYMETSND